MSIWVSNGGGEKGGRTCAYQWNRASRVRGWISWRVSSMVGSLVSFQLRSLIVGSRQMGSLEIENDAKN